MDKVKAMMKLKKFPKEGFSFCCHHNKLFEYCSDFESRVKAIYDTKPEDEHETRFKNFTYIPARLLPKKGLNGLNKAREAYVKAREAYDKAWKAHDKAREAYVKAREARDKAREAYVKAREAHNKAWKAHNKAWKAHNKAREAYVKTNSDKLLKLFNELNPSNTWNGKNIGWE